MAGGTRGGRLLDGERGGIFLVNEKFDSRGGRLLDPPLNEFLEIVGYYFIYKN